MISVYYGGADRDLDPFMYGRIADGMPHDTILLVPDQFTLQAERDAFHYLNASALLELEIMSRSGLARRILDYVGSPAGIPVNKYGRFMLLSVLADSLDRREGLFSGAADSISFVEMLTDLITELKQYGVTADDLEDIEELFDDDPLLCGKLEQLRDIYGAYEDIIRDKYTDSEDLQNYVNASAADFPRIASSRFWISGFDYMSPTMLGMIESIASAAPEVNIVFAGDNSDDDVFEVPRRMRKELKLIAERLGIEYREEYVEPVTEKPEPEVHVVKAGDFYSEAETAAVMISELIREQGYRYSDIVVLCNDMKKRGSIYKRIFENYGIPLFMDDKRVIAQEPAVLFITSIMDCIERHRQFDDVFRMLKTGFGPLEDEECDRLEVYCRQYHIRSGRWKKPFVYGASEKGEEALAEINASREKVDRFLHDAEVLFKDKKTVREKVEALYEFLVHRASMPQRIRETKDRLEQNRMREAAETSGQIWNAIIVIMDQLVEVLGEEEMSAKAFADVLREGFGQVKIGMIPTAGDQVLLGTMQRTRFGQVKALFVMGANDGVLPEEGSAEGLLSDDEKQLIAERFRTVGRTDELRSLEQSLSIFRNLGKAEDHLVITYADQDTEGKELWPSHLVSEILAAEQKDGPDFDVLHQDDKLRLVQDRRGTMPHLIASLRGALDGETADDVWKAAALELQGSAEFENVRRGLFFENTIERAEKGLIRELFGRRGSGELIFSASSLERYSRCPFSFLINHGLRPSEDRAFEVDMRSVGDIYHDCLRRITETLTTHDMDICDSNSRWMFVTQEEVAEMAGRYIDEFAEVHREGILRYSLREEFMLERIKAAAANTAWLMIEQVRSGTVRGIYFEQSFGQKAQDMFPPIAIQLDDGSQVTVEGKIDRVDILNVEGEEDGFVRIIDYKTGSEAFDLEEVRSGWRMQLMIYLRGAMGGIRMSRPAGVFYFSVKSDLIDVTGKAEDELDQIVAKEQKKQAKLDGVLVNDPAVIDSMDGDFTGYSSVIPVRKTKGGFSEKDSHFLEPEAFEDLILVNDENMRKAAEGLAGGRVDADPKKGKKTDACTYCKYSSVCNIL